MISNLRTIAMGVAATLFALTFGWVGWEANELFGPDRASEVLVAAAPPPPAVVAVGTSRTTRTETKSDGSKVRTTTETPVATPMPVTQSGNGTVTVQPGRNYYLGIEVPTKNKVEWGDLSLQAGARLGDSPFTLGVEWAPSTNSVSTSLRYEF